MWLKLALLFGEPNVGELQEKIDAKQFMEWVAYNNVHCLPDSWNESARLAQCFSGVKPNDFIPTKKEKLSNEDIWNAFKRKAARHGKDS